ncbi:MAG: TlpA disulfide reductase family protein [Gemmatimonadales bacterium]
MNAVVRRSWVATGLIAVLLGLGTWLLVRSVSPREGVDVGERVPDYRVERAALGDTIGLRTTYAGHVTLINIWATWCAPCLREMPSLEQLYQRYRSRGFRVAAVSIDDSDTAPVLAFAHRLGVSFDILHDKSGGIQAAYRVVGMPTSVLVDRRGRVAWVTLGAKDWNTPDNAARVARLLPGGR